MALRSEDKRAASDAVTTRRLAPTLHYEGVLLAEMAGLGHRGSADVSNTNRGGKPEVVARAIRPFLAQA